MTPKELDQFACAELPNQCLSEKDCTGKPMVDEKGKPIHKWDENDEKVMNPLWTAVTSFMLHGPCGQYNPSLGCMVDGCCQFGYIRFLQNNTYLICSWVILSSLGNKMATSSTVGPFR